MTDQEYLRLMEAQFAAAFYPPFGGRNFFNQELFEYVLDKAGDDVEELNREMMGVNAKWASDGQMAKLRADNARRAVKLKIYTPSGNCKVTITSDGVLSREMDPDE